MSTTKPYSLTMPVNYSAGELWFDLPGVGPRLFTPGVTHHADLTFDKAEEFRQMRGFLVAEVRPAAAEPAKSTKSTKPADPAKE